MDSTAVRPKLGTVELPPFSHLFDSQQQSHDEMMKVVNEVCQQLKAEGQPVPEFKRFYRDVRTCWELWSKYAPTV